MCVFVCVCVCPTIQCLLIYVDKNPASIPCLHLVIVCAYVCMYVCVCVCACDCPTFQCLLKCFDKRLLRSHVYTL